MEPSEKTSIKALLWILGASLVALAGSIFLQDFMSRSFLLPSILTTGALLLVCGVWLIGLTVKRRVQGKLRKFLMLAGICAAGIIISIVLHNLIYGLFIYWFGPNFWTQVLGTDDEFVFFILGIVVCPVGLIVGIIGSSVQLSKAFD